jgi:fumarylpyruvate hydrolase
MSFVIDPPATTAVPVRGGGSFPVRTIYCVGRNYWAHRAEMGVEDRDPPFFFCKGRDAILPVPDGRTGAMRYPPRTDNLHHEIELVVAIGRAGAEIAAADVADHIYGYAVGLDMTRRDLQGAAKDKGRPWDMGKAFFQAAPIGEIAPIAETGELTAGRIELDVNGEARQDADLADMIWSVREIVEDLSRYGGLEPGDLIFTGTPAGVGPVARGDRLDGRVAGLSSLSVEIV